MLRHIASILLLGTLAGGNSASAAVLCTSPSNQRSVGLPQHHCRMDQAAATSVMSCCHHAPVLDQPNTGHGSSNCCQMSAPPLSQPSTTLPANASDEFKLN